MLLLSPLSHCLSFFFYLSLCGQEYTANEAQNISPEQMAIIIWAFAKLRIRPSDRWGTQ